MSAAAEPINPAILAEATATLPFVRALTRRVAAELVTLRDELKSSTSKGAAMDLVTRADGHAEQALTSALHATFPGHLVAGEEGTRLGPADSPWTWHIDPLDGTANYARDLPFWALSVGLAYGHRPVAGVIVAPLAGLDLAGVLGALPDGRGGQVWSGDRLLEPPTHPGEPKTWVISTDWPWALAERRRTVRFLDYLVTRVRQYKSFGSTACELAHLALGKVDAYAISHVFPWDQCAGAAMAQALGFELRRWDGTPWDLRHPDIVACRPGMWDELAPGLVGPTPAVTND